MGKLVLGLVGICLVAAACSSAQQSRPSTAGGQSGPSTSTGHHPAASTFADGPVEIQVTASDFVFEGVPETIKAGDVTFVLTNEGAVAHEMAIGTLPGDTTVQQAVGPGDAGTERVGVVTTVEPGKTGKVTLALEPGRYGYVCFLGEGTNDEPHALHGMLGEFMVVNE